MGRLSLIVITLLFCALPQARADLINTRDRLQNDFKGKNLTWGARIFVRIFKDSKELEVWVEQGKSYTLFRTYPICYFSGGLGPKKKRGDGRAPEGFYEAKKSQLNPGSAYHLAVNVGYPNAYDQHHGYTGSHIMIHGDCVSIGCFAMTDSRIEEIYALIEVAVQKPGESVPIHIFPFRMSWLNMWRYQRFPSYTFWWELRPAFLQFEKTHRPPRIKVIDGKYVIVG